MKQKLQASVGSLVLAVRILNVVLGRLGRCFANAIKMCLPSEADDDADNSITIQHSFNTGYACMESHDDTVNHRFCGVDKCDADHRCGTPCPNGDECPSGESCFDNTPCSSNVDPPPVEFAYCGTSAEDAQSSCWQPCRDDGDCCYGEKCYTNVTECVAPNFQGSEHFFCGTGECSYWHA